MQTRAGARGKLTEALRLSMDTRLYPGFASNASQVPAFAKGPKRGVGSGRTERGAEWRKS